MPGWQRVLRSSFPNPQASVQLMPPRRWVRSSPKSDAGAKPCLRHHSPIFAVRVLKCVSFPCMDRGVDAPAPTAPQPVSHTPGEGVNVETRLKDDGNSSRMMLLLSGQRSLCLAEVWHKWSDLRLLDHEPLWHAHAKRNPAKASESRCQCHAPGRCQQQWKFF